MKYQLAQLENRIILQSALHIKIEENYKNLNYNMSIMLSKFIWYIVKETMKKVINFSSEVMIEVSIYIDAFFSKK